MANAQDSRFMSAQGGAFQGGQVQAGPASMQSFASFAQSPMAMQPPFPGSPHGGFAPGSPHQHVGGTTAAPRQQQSSPNQGSRGRRFTVGQFHPAYAQYQMQQQQQLQMQPQPEQQQVYSEESMMQLNSVLDDMNNLSFEVQTRLHQAEERDRMREPQYDEEGNLVPGTGEDYAESEDAFSAAAPVSRGNMPGMPPPHLVQVPPKVPEEALLITEGDVWKKGSGEGFTGRRNWKQRYLVLDTKAFKVSRPRPCPRARGVGDKADLRHRAHSLHPPPGALVLVPV